MIITRLLILFFLLALAPSATAQSLSDVVTKIEAAQSRIAKMTADANLRFDLAVGFIPYSDSLKGTYTYEAPDTHRFEFPDAPSYLQELPGMFNWELPKPEKYTGKLKGPFRLDGREVYKLLYLPVNPDSKVRSITVTVDTAEWLFRRHETDYKDGGTLNLDFTHTTEDGLKVLQTVQAQLNIVAFKLKGTAGIDLSRHKIQKK